MTEKAIRMETFVAGGFKVFDDDGVQVRDGDILHFSYGIPPVGVNASVIRRNGELIVLTPGHNPAECPLRIFPESAGNFWVERKKRKK